MNERFTLLPVCWVEDGDLLVTDLRINPFQIESYMPININYQHEDEEVEEEGTRIYMKSGVEFDIMIPIGEFDKLFK